MAPLSCSLDSAGAESQMQRYRRIGAGAELAKRTARRLEVALAPDVDPGEVDEALRIESECCSFFGLGFDREARRLSFSVDRPEYEPALEAIESALGLSPAS
jgi:hypothetical protein